MLAMFSLQACLISCKDNGTEGNLDTTMLVMSSDGGKRSFPVSSDAHISYIQDKKTTYELSFFQYIPTEKYNGLTIKFIGTAEDYFNVYVKKDEKQVNDKIKEWNEKNYENILNNSITNETKQEFLNLLGVKEGNISINYKTKI